MSRNIFTQKHFCIWWSRLSAVCGLVKHAKGERSFWFATIEIGQDCGFLAKLG
jgi:hypothetical protein